MFPSPSSETRIVVDAPALPIGAFSWSKKTKAAIESLPLFERELSEAYDNRDARNLLETKRASAPDAKAAAFGSAVAEKLVEGSPSSGAEGTGAKPVAPEEHLGGVASLGLDQRQRLLLLEIKSQWILQRIFATKDTQTGFGSDSAGGYVPRTESIAGEHVAQRPYIADVRDKVGRELESMLSAGRGYSFVQLSDGRAVTLQLHASHGDAEAWVAARAEEEKYAKYDAWREKIEGWKAEIKALDEAAKNDRTNATGERLRNPDRAPPLYGYREKESLIGESRPRKLSAFEWYERHYQALVQMGVLFQMDANAIDTRWVGAFRDELKRTARNIVVENGVRVAVLTDFLPTKTESTLQEAQRYTKFMDVRAMRRVSETVYRQ